MKILLYFSFLLILMPNVFQTRMTIDDNQLIIRSNENFEGYLYKDDQLFRPIEKTEYENGMIVYDDIEAGIYTLYDKDGKSKDQKVLYDNNIHIAFDYMVKYRKDNHLLFQEHPKMTIISPMKIEEYDFEEIDGYYKYEFHNDEVHFINNIYQIHVDDTIPEVSIDGIKELNTNTFITNSPTIMITYEDTCPEIFKYLDNGELTIELEEGKNDISSYFIDLAGNTSLEECFVIYDNRPPIIDIKDKIYINQSKTIIIDEPNLDFQKSVIKKENGEMIYLNSNEFIIDTSGVYTAHLFDLAGNESVITFEIVVDMVAPNVTSSLDGQYLQLSYTEDLLVKEVELIFNDQKIEQKDEKFYLEKEGRYILHGTLVDLAGNTTIIDKEIQGDFTAPIIYTNIDNDVYLNVPEIKFSIRDLFNVQWRCELYQNNQLICSKEGSEVSENIIKINELDIGNLEGVFDITIITDDGLHETKLSKKFCIDLKCKPINLFINGCIASSVDEIMVNKDVIFDANCDEGIVYYHLYDENGIIVKEGIVDSVTISNQQTYSKIEFYANDSYGHKTNKWIVFEYPQAINIGISDEIDTHERVEKSVLNQMDSTESNEIEYPGFVQLSTIFGGVICVLIIIRIFLYEKNRHRENKDNLSGEKTILLQNTKSTECLCDSQDSE